MSRRVLGRAQVRALGCRFHGVQGEGWVVTGGGCSPVLLRIHPYQLQIKGVNTVALEEDKAQVSSRAQSRHSPSLLAQPCPEHQPAHDTPGVPRLLSPACPALNPSAPPPAPHLQAGPLAPFPLKGLARNLGSAPPAPNPAPSRPVEWSSGNAAQTPSAPARSLSKAPAAWGGWRLHCWVHHLRPRRPLPAHVSPPITPSTPQHHGHSTLAPSRACPEISRRCDLMCLLPEIPALL